MDTGPGRDSVAYRNAGEGFINWLCFGWIYEVQYQLVRCLIYDLQGAVMRACELS